MGWFDGSNCLAEWMIIGPASYEGVVHAQLSVESSRQNLYLWRHVLESNLVSLSPQLSLCYPCLSPQPPHTHTCIHTHSPPHTHHHTGRVQ